MLTKTEAKTILPGLKSFLQERVQGISFSLVTRDPTSSELKVHERVSQPCWGELRKYKVTHPEDCTQPLDKRPSDLKNPFPKIGIPEALALSIPINRNIEKFLWSDQSPWVSGFGGEDNLIIHNRGVILKDLSIDPTVLINLAKNSQRGSNTEELFNFLTKKAGISPKKAVLALLFAGAHHKYFYSPKLNGPDTYVNPMTVDVERYLEQKPKDLTGGTLKDRFDYNRKELAGIFKGTSAGRNITSELSGHVKMKGSYTYEVEPESLARGIEVVLG